MNTELFSTLETKIEQMLEEMELLRMEVSELREEKAQLDQEKTQLLAERQNWDQKLQGLLSRFDAVEG